MFFGVWGVVVGILGGKSPRTKPAAGTCEGYPNDIRLTPHDAGVIGTPVGMDIEGEDTRGCASQEHVFEGGWFINEIKTK